MSYGYKTNTGRQVTLPAQKSLGVVRGRRPSYETVQAPKPITNYAADYAQFRQRQAAQNRRDIFGGVLSSASTITGTIAGASAAGTVGASLAPVAVGLGLGYGVFKLGEALKVW